MNLHPIVDVSNFSKRYGTFQAVDDLSFFLYPGQIVGLVGQNGAGKTTTLKALAGILRPTSGTLTVAGHDVVGSSLAAKRALGYIPDDPRLFDTLTVWEHLEFIASAYGLRQYRATANSLLAEFDLLEKRDTVTRALSRGMRQKVAIMCACLPQPQILLFDEPLTGLDPGGIRAIQHSIRVRAKQGTGIIISSHLLNLVEDLCTHVLVLQTGRRRWFGPTEDLLKATQWSDRQATLEEAFFGIIGATPDL